MHPKGQLVGYIRVSTVDQNTGRQEEAINALNPDEVFIDKASGKDANRPELEKAIRHCRKGDQLVVFSMDRLARNLDDLRRIVMEMTAKGVEVRFLKESLTFSGDDSPMSKLLLSVMGGFAEFEWALIRERQREGIELAKRRGVYKGRKSVITPELAGQVQEKLAAGVSKSRIARDLGVSRETIYKVLRVKEA